MPKLDPIGKNQKINYVSKGFAQLLGKYYQPNTFGCFEKSYLVRDTSCIRHKDNELTKKFFLNSI